MKRIISKNDVWRILGIVLLVAGQFMSKEPYSGLGITLESNLVQITGAILLLMPFVLRLVEIYKGKKQEDNPQG